MKYDALPILQTLSGLGLVRALTEGQFQITDMGMASLTVERKVHSMQPAFLPRDDVALSERTVWELLVLLMEQGWRALPYGGSLLH